MGGAVSFQSKLQLQQELLQKSIAYERIHESCPEGVFQKFVVYEKGGNTGYISIREVANEIGLDPQLMNILFGNWSGKELDLIEYSTFLDFLLTEHKPEDNTITVNGPTESMNKSNRGRFILNTGSKGATYSTVFSTMQLDVVGWRLSDIRALK